MKGRPGRDNARFPRAEAAFDPSPQAQAGGSPLPTIQAPRRKPGDRPFIRSQPLRQQFEPVGELRVDPLAVEFRGGEPAAKVTESAVPLAMLRTASLAMAVFDVPSVIFEIFTFEFSKTIPSVGLLKSQ